MNRKKISSLILTCLIMSNALSGSVVYGASTDTTILNSIETLNAESKTFDNIESSLINKNANTTQNTENNTTRNFDTGFYVLNNSKYIKVNSFNGDSISPAVMLSSTSISHAKYLDCKITKTDNSSNKTIEYSRYGNISNKDYILPSINTQNIKNISIEYNLIDDAGNVMQKSFQDINSDTAAPNLSIQSANYSVSSSSTHLNLCLKVSNESYINMFSKPIVYLNNAAISNANTSYDSSTGLYTIALDIPASNSEWNLQVFTCDDSLNVSSTSIDSSSLINFKNTISNAIYSGDNNVVQGTIVPNKNIKDLKINNNNVSINSNSFSYVNSSKSNMDATYTFGANNTPIKYTANFISYENGPNLKNITINSNNVQNGQTVYLKSNVLNLNGTLDSIIKNGIVVDSIKYTYGNNTPVSVPYNSDNNNLTIQNFKLPNDDESKCGELQITAHDALSNKSSFSFKLYAACGVKTPSVSLSSGNSVNNINGVEYFDKNVAPSVDTDSNPLIDFINSNFTLGEYNNFSFSNLINSSIFNFMGNALQNIENIFSFKDPIKDGNYILTTNLKDIGGNSAFSKLSFIVDTRAPEIAITNTDKSINKNGFSNSKNVTETVNVSDANFKSAKAVISKDNVIEKTDILKNNTPVPYKFTTDGIYTISVSADDQAFNKSSSDANFVIDTTAPTASIDNIVNNQYYDKLINPEVNVTEKNIDLSSSYFDIKEDNGTSRRYYFTDKNVISNNLSEDNTKYTLANVVNDDGKYDLTVHIEDLAGNKLQNDLQSTFYTETSDVTPSISGVTNNSNVQNTVTPTVEINDKFLTDGDFGPGKAIQTSLNGNPYNLNFDSKDGNILKFTGDPISGNTPRGQQYNLVISASNKVHPDERKTSTVNFVIDNEAPSISFSDANGKNINNGGYYNGTVIPSINISDNYKVTSYNVTINGSEYNGSVSTDSNGNIVFTGSPITSDGTYDIKISASDEAGNVSNYEKTFTLDNTCPYVSISGVTNGEYTNSFCVTPYIKVTDKNIDLSRTTFYLKKNNEVIPVMPILNGDSYYFNLYDEGNYTLIVTAFDKASNSYTTSPINFTIDRTAPVLNFNFKNGSYINRFFRPSVTTEDPSDFIIKLIINGIEYSAGNLPILSDNRGYDITAEGEDKAGNLSPITTMHFTLDTIAPFLTVQNLTDNYYYNRNVGPYISSTDVNPNIFYMTLNGRPYNNEPITAEGSYELVITSIDKAGNISTRVIDFVIDKTAPSITIKGLINYATLTSIIDPLISIDDPNADVTILLDGVPYHGGPITTDGKHTLIIEAVDKAGNISRKVIVFFLKTTPPNVYVSGIENGKDYDHSVTPSISFSKDVVSSDTVMTLDGNSYKQGDSISSEGKHELYISVKDSAGNKTVKKIDFTITVPQSLAASIPTTLHKFLPKNITKSHKSLFIAIVSAIFIAIGTVGVAILKIRTMKKKDSIKPKEDK
ncbi:MAG: Ig-like domain-containing protein [Clostridium sp.]|nr:Ig-like domain-containing protein [Clostridium sp.]